MNETNWSSTIKPNITDYDVKGLEKAKKKERLMIKNGWRWKKINGRVSVLVPCDKNGNPTEHGLKIIKKQKSLL